MRLTPWKKFERSRSTGPRSSTAGSARGHILDAFKITYDLAPDEAARRIVLRSRRDEARDVSSGSS